MVRNFNGNSVIKFYEGQNSLECEYETIICDTWSTICTLKIFRKILNIS